jgi:hypothetical protein
MTTAPTTLPSVLAIQTPNSESCPLAATKPENGTTISDGMGGKNVFRESGKGDARVADTDNDAFNPDNDLANDVRHLWAM